MKFLHRLHLESLALLIVLGGCAGGSLPPPPPPPPPPPVEDALAIDSTDIKVLAALLRMEDERIIDRARISAWVDHPNRLIRSRSVLAIGRVKDGESLHLVLVRLTDPSATVRADAAFALSLLGDTTAAVIEALTRVVNEPVDPRPGVEAAAALGRLATPSSFAALTTLLHSSTPRFPDMTREALLHLWRAPRSAELVETVRPYLRSNDPSVRWNAAYALSRPGGQLAVAPLLAVAGDEDPAVRALAVRALRAPAADSAEAREGALAALRQALSDVHPHVRINALAALATFAEPADLPAVADRLADPDMNVRVAAAQALGEMGGTGAARALAASVRDPVIPTGVRATALAALVRVDPPAGLELAEEWSRGTSWLLRLHATRAIASAQASESTNGLLLERARDPDPRVAATAIRTLSSRQAVPGLHSVLLERLASADAAVRAAATAGLGREPRAADVALLFEAYDRARHDSIPSAALAAVDVLGALQDQGIPVANAFFMRFPPAADARVRQRVAQRLGEDGWSGPEGEAPEEPDATPRSDAFYEDAIRTLLAPAATGPDRPRVVIGTDRGEIVLELAPEHAPLTVLNFLSLIRAGYYLGDDHGSGPRLRWHRVVPNFVLQDGDPRGDGAGNPGYAIRDELSPLRYGRGVLGMALSGPDSGGGQYFITVSPQPHLDAGYTVFGRVIEGMGVADAIVQDDPIRFIREVR